MAGRGELPPSHVGRRLRALRVSRDLSQGQAAEMIGVHVNTIARVEREELEPTAAFVSAAAKAFSVDCRVLLGPDESLPPPPASPPGRPQKVETEQSKEASAELGKRKKK